MIHIRCGFKHFKAYKCRKCNEDDLSIRYKTMSVSNKSNPYNGRKTNMFYVQCNNCDNTSKSVISSRHKAVAQWNREQRREYGK